MKVLAKSGGSLLLACLSMIGCTSPAPDAAGRAPLQETSPPSIPIKVMRPGGAGPFSAVVILHDCSGLGSRSSGAPERWSKVLLAQGYVVLIPDSFSTRGHGEGVCTDGSPSRNEVNPYRRVRDAYEALAYARSLPYVDGAHVGVMGGSHGGSTTLATMVDKEGAPPGHGFSAAIALYPGCNARYGDWRPGGVGVYKPLAPTLVLVGEKDDWTPAEPCRQLAERSRAAGYPVAVKIYPGAHHSFDSDRPVRYVETRVNGNAPGGRGATTGGNAEAWADSIREVTAFFARYLHAP
jgi:dienelactone hydrolase